MSSSPEFAIAFTHFLKGAPRLSAFRRGNSTQQRSNVEMSEQQRRLDLIEELHRLHARLMKDALASVADVGALPPDRWLNEQLANLGERWRVQNVDGFRYEIYNTP